MAEALSSVGYGSAITPNGWDNSLSPFGVTNYEAPSSGKTVTIETPTFSHNPIGWLDQNFASPVIDSLGLGGLLGSSSISSQLDKALPVNGSSASTSSGGFWSDLFLRTVVIVLGFIFVAVGLSMFKGASIIEQVKK